MAMIERSYGTVKITTDSTLHNVSNIMKGICSESKGVMVYIGDRVVRQRTRLVFVKIDRKIYYVQSSCGVLGSCTIELEEFKGDFEATEPISDFKYFLEYYNPGLNSRNCTYFYYKENEKEIAEKAQEVMGKDLTFLYEI